MQWNTPLPSGSSPSGLDCLSFEIDAPGSDSSQVFHLVVAAYRDKAIARDSNGLGLRLTLIHRDDIGIVKKQLGLRGKRAKAPRWRNSRRFRPFEFMALLQKQLWRSQPGRHSNTLAGSAPDSQQRRQSFLSTPLLATLNCILHRSSIFQLWSSDSTSFTPLVGPSKPAARGRQ
jgi:hypothetical protein